MDNHDSIESFTFDTGESYGVQFEDWSNAGVMLTITRPNADHYTKQCEGHVQRVMLPSDEFDRFLRWASRTTGRAAFVLPPKTRIALERTLATGRISKRSRKIFRQAIRTLRNLETELTLLQRALNR